MSPTPCVLALSAAVVIALTPTSALAFDTFESFGAPVIGVAQVPPADPPVEPKHGGGDGRYFTGSIPDGFSCSVCHFGGPTSEDIELEVTPDPFEDGYIAGNVYEIVITGPDRNWAATLELVDAQGHGAGDLELVNVGADPHPCDHIIEIPNLADPSQPPRQVAGNDLDTLLCSEGDDNRLLELRVTWTAPETTTGGIWLNAGIVTAGPDLGTPENDHTILIARMIAPFGTDPESGRVINSCAASHGEGSSLPAFGFLALALTWFARRRARVA